jgi:hypothetical protein
VLLVDALKSGGDDDGAITNDVEDVAGITLSVEMRIWCPSSDRAGTPMSIRVMASSAEDTCSPVASRTSPSRASGCLLRLPASSSSRFVSPAIAETTTMTSLPAARVAAARRATALMRSALPTDVPPYFCTVKATDSVSLPVV